MQKRTMAIFAAGLLLAQVGFTISGFAKNKKPVLPPYVLTARTVAVIIDPSAGVSIDDPQANEIARADVEAALRTWGRFEVIDTRPADLLIVVRRGNGHLVNPTISDPRQNSSVTPDAGIGPENGRPANMPGSMSNPGSTPRPLDDRPTPQTEVGRTDDTFVVYRGDVDRPLDSPPAWKYTSSDALQPHAVLAVEQFKRAVVEADKAAAAAKGP
jgi:hypothetical protein